MTSFSYLWLRVKYRLVTFLYENRFSSFSSFFCYEKNNAFFYTKLKAALMLGYVVNLDVPKTFNEKLIYRRLFSRNPIWVKVTDKISARSWVRDNGYTDIVKLIPAHAYYDIDELMKMEVDRPLVVKAAWASGANIFISTNEELERSLPTLKKWLNEPYKVTSLIWASSQIQRGFLVENKLTSESGEVPVDYKFFVINGSVEFIQVDIGRFTKHQRALFDAKGVRLPYFFTSYENASKEEELPEYVTNTMVGIAEKLGKRFSFVRVDLYYYDGDVYFGELTQTPSAGFGRFNNKEFDISLGNKWEGFNGE